MSSQLVVRPGSRVSYEMFVPGVDTRSVGERLGRVRWARLVVLLAVVVILGVSLVAWVSRATVAHSSEAVSSVATSSSTSGGDGAVIGSGHAALREHVVAPGDTLWQIAEAAAPSEDPREMVDRIIALNGLDGAEVQVGTVVLVPR